jgi:hypothetical protein
MHSGRNFDALVGMDSLSKAAFHRTLRRHPKYTQAYLDHAYDIVHDFRKCDIRVLHEIEPKEGGAVQDDEDKKDCKPDPTKKPVEIGSPPSIKTDSPSNQMVTGFPPTPDEFVYVEEDCMKYVHASGPLDIGCDFEAVSELVLSNLTRSSFQYTEGGSPGLLSKQSSTQIKALLADQLRLLVLGVNESPSKNLSATSTPPLWSLRLAVFEKNPSRIPISVESNLPHISLPIGHDPQTKFSLSVAYDTCAACNVGYAGHHLPIAERYP